MSALAAYFLGVASGALATLTVLAPFGGKPAQRKEHTPMEAHDHDTSFVVVRQAANGEWFYEHVAANNEVLEVGETYDGGESAAVDGAKTAHPDLPIFIDRGDGRQLLESAGDESGGGE